MKIRDSTKEALEKANLLTLQEKRQVHDAVYVKKALSDKLPANICLQYQKQQSLRTFRSAEKQVLTIPKHKTENYKNSPLYRSIVAWNNTPTHIKTLDITTFKQKLQAHIQKKTQTQILSTL